jgi:hypothetical protein
MGSRGQSEAAREDEEGTGQKSTAGQKDAQKQRRLALRRTPRPHAAGGTWPNGEQRTSFNAAGPRDILAAFFTEVLRALRRD